MIFLKRTLFLLFFAAFIPFLTWHSGAFAVSPTSVDTIVIELSGSGIDTVTQTYEDFTGVKIIKTGLTPGSYVVSLTAKDDGGATVYSATKDITVRAGATTTVSLYDMQVVTDVIPGLAGGEEHSIALKKDGNIWAWGHNNFGQLGDASNADSPNPVETDHSTELIAATQVSTKGGHSVALRFDGSVWAWGDNDCGQLGNGEEGNCVFNVAPELSENIPVQVVDASFQPLTGITSVSAGQEHSVALKSDGSVWAWGNNFDGQLGDTTSFVREFPVQTVTPTFQPFTTVSAVSGGFAHTLALKTDGSVWSWGLNDYNQLGYNGFNPLERSPVQVCHENSCGFGNLTGVAVISAGGYHNVVLKSDGTILSWGQNEFGQIGNNKEGDLNLATKNGADDFEAIPVPLSGGLSGVTAIAAGNAHTLALKSDGTVWAWGSNDFGQLGNNSVGDGDPATVVAGDYEKVRVQVCHESGCGFGNLTGIISIGAGFRHSFAVKRDGTVYAWGDNDCGQLGNGLDGDCDDITLLSEHSNIPVQVTGGFDVNN